jgi:hypothetical protein
MLMVFTKQKTNDWEGLSTTFLTRQKVLRVQPKEIEEMGETEKRLKQ